MLAVLLLSAAGCYPTELCFTPIGYPSRNGVGAAGKRELVSGTRKTSLISSAPGSPATPCGSGTGPKNPTSTDSWRISVISRPLQPRGGLGQESRSNRQQPAHWALCSGNMGRRGRCLRHNADLEYRQCTSRSQTEIPHNLQIIFRFSPL